MKGIIKRAATMALAAAVAIGAVSAITPATQVEAASVKLSKTKATLKIGEKLTLKLKNAKGTVKWETSNKKVAKVTKGKVTAVAAGKATITAKNGKKSYKCKITVESSYESLKKAIKKKGMYNEEENFYIYKLWDDNNGIGTEYVYYPNGDEYVSDYVMMGFFTYTPGNSSEVHTYASLYVNPEYYEKGVSLYIVVEDWTNNKDTRVIYDDGNFTAVDNDGNPITDTALANLASINARNAFNNWIGDLESYLEVPTTGIFYFE